MLNLNDDAIKSEGNGGFDTSKIFGYSVVEKVDNVDNIVRTLDNVVVVGFNQGVSNSGSKFWDLQMKDPKGNENNCREYDIDTSATFPELWSAIEVLMKQHQCNTKPIRLKLIYNKAGYLAVPAYVPFMESMTVAAEQSKLKLNPDFDTLVRPQKSNPADVMSAPAAAGGDVPFAF